MPTSQTPTSGPSRDLRLLCFIDASFRRFGRSATPKLALLRAEWTGSYSPTSATESHASDLRDATCPNEDTAFSDLCEAPSRFVPPASLSTVSGVKEIVVLRPAPFPGVLSRVGLPPAPAGSGGRLSTPLSLSILLQRHGVKVV